MHPEKIRIERGRGSVEVVVEDIGDVGHCALCIAPQSLCTIGIALPQRTTLLIDPRHAFSLDESAADLKLESLANGEDIYFALLWHRFVTAASLLGEVTECNPSKASEISGAGSRIRQLKGRPTGRSN